MVSPSAEPPKPVLKDLPVEIDVNQRSTTPVPGSEGKLLLTVDDITRGQVMVSLATSDGDSILPLRSMKRGDELPFQYDESPFVLKLLELSNELVGEDAAQFSISAGATKQQKRTPLSEAEKIEWLIQQIAALEGAVFIRNGAEHTSVEAAEHLKMKWQAAAERISTAEQFIEHIASKSSLTGEAYQIQLPGGHRIPARRWLHEQLANLEQTDAAID